MNNIIDVAHRRDEIMASQKIFCPFCSEKQFSPFDKLFTEAYGECVNCSSIEEDLVELSENIFRIIEG